MIIDITNKFVKQFIDKLEDKGILLIVKQNALQKLNELWFDKNMGARSVNRAINNEFKNNISKKIINGQIKYGYEVTIEYKLETFVYSYKKLPRRIKYPRIRRKLPSIDMFDDEIDYDFDNFKDAQKYAMEHTGVSVTRSPSGNGWIKIEKKENLDFVDIPF